MIPLRLASPTVGLMPTMPLVCDVQMIDPSVSVPMAAAHMFAATAAPEPEDEPQALRSNAYGFLVNPPRLDQPLMECLPRKFAHSLRFVFPRMTAPAARNRLTMKASRRGIEPSNANDPDVVCMRSCVSMLSLIRIGIPCSGPRSFLALRSASRLDAMSSASGLISITALTAGP